MEAKPCGLISIIPPALQQEWAANLTELAGRFRPAAIVFRDPAPAILAQAIAGAKPFELAVLVCGPFEEAAAAGAQGVYFDQPDADIAGARRLLGPAGIIGTACGLSRHSAMEAAEAGVEFVVFDASTPEALEEAADLSEWWDEITGVPCALGLGRSRPGESVLSKARADFLVIEEVQRSGESLTFATELGLQSQT